MEYLFIFISKIIIDALTTYRIIILSKNKKLLGASLEFFISLIWIFVTKKIVLDGGIYKIFIFALASFIGSLIGSFIKN